MSPKRTFRALTRIQANLLQPVYPASLGVFRIAFGTILALEMATMIERGDVHRHFVAPRIHFTYPGFNWVCPWPEPWMTAHVAGLLVLGVLIALGWYYRLAATLFALGFTYLFLIEQTLYLNHFYLVILLSVLLAVIPAHAFASVDSWRIPKLKNAAKRWHLHLLRSQVGLVYCFAGIAKLNEDWLRGEPLRTWLSSRGDLALIGPLLELEVTAWLFSYGALVLDLFAWPALLWTRTRTFAFKCLLGFHLGNSILFGIGIFPWLMIAATSLFFDPDWPIRLWPGQRHRSARTPVPLDPTPARGHLATAFLLAYLAVQVLIPLRHFLYDGVVHWNEDGHMFAWHMMLRTKRGEASFLINDASSGETFIVDPRIDLEPWQIKDLTAKPDLIWQYARVLQARYRERGHVDLSIKATTEVSLNGRPRQPLIDPGADLLDMPRHFGSRRWIVPLEDR